MIFIFKFLLVADAQSKKESEVAEAVEIFVKGIIDADKNLFENIISDDVVYSHSSGKLQDKEAFIEGIISGQPLVYQSITISDQLIKIVGKTAIVRHNFSSQTMNNSLSGNLNLGVMQIWRKQQGRWKLIARQAYRI